MSDAGEAADAADSDAVGEQNPTDRGATDADRNASVATSEPIAVEGEDHLADLVAEHDVVVVDFHADWCGPCQMMEPIVAAIAGETTATVAKIDVDRHQSLASQYQVQGVPTLVLFANGDRVERLVGRQDEETLSDLVDQYDG